MSNTWNRRVSLAAAAALMLCAAAQGQIIEDFEAGNLNAYTQSGTSNNTSATNAAAYNGNFGVSFTSGTTTFFYRNDVTTSAGNSYFGYVRTTDVTGRVYLGVDAGAGGMVSAVFAPNTSQILLQSNAGFGFSTLGADAFTYDPNVWYLLEMNWIASGSMQVRLWDESGSSLLADTGVVAVPVLGGGGLGFRGFATGTTGQQNHLDTIFQNVIPSPGVLALLGLAGVCGVSRRRRA